LLRAQEIRFDRRSNRVFARGDVVLIEPDGNVGFASEVELTGDFREGVLRDLRGLLPENGRLAANGARRSDGNVTELSRAVYSTCNLCPENPERPPLWQLRAERAQRDEARGQIAYYDAMLEMWGIPVTYLPYFEHADPSVGRRTGLLPPSFGHSSYLGGFLEVPYYWTLGDSADITLAPMLTTRQNLMLSGEYRRRFANGILNLQASGTVDQESRFRGHIFTTGRFDLDETWRWGFQFQRVSDVTYLRRYRFNQPRLLTSTLFAEGFGENSYTYADTLAYQGLRAEDDDRRLPVVAPRFFHERVFQPGGIGGRLTADISSFSVFRPEGTDTQRIASRLNWQRPFRGDAGDLWRLQVNLDVAGYHASDIVDPTNPARKQDGFIGRALPTVALDWRMPFVRHDSWSSQVIEPMVMFAAAPNVGNDWRVPNEDSLDFEFGDTNLFSLNRFTGRDRLEGGTRFNYGVRGALYTHSGAGAELMLGQSWRLHQDDSFFAGSGLARR
ncbi:MAG: LPS-assembly protein LptD, partial [Alphaproteobacteria bacterium]|nr:LPS-assembly protein LptD [Alphaproteobacteria bacterium]